MVEPTNHHKLTAGPSPAQKAAWNDAVQRLADAADVFDALGTVEGTKAARQVGDLVDALGVYVMTE